MSRKTLGPPTPLTASEVCFGNTEHEAQDLWLRHREQASLFPPGSGLSGQTPGLECVWAVAGLEVQRGGCAESADPRDLPATGPVQLQPQVVTNSRSILHPTGRGGAGYFPLVMGGFYPKAQTHREWTRHTGAQMPHPSPASREKKQGSVSGKEVCACGGALLLHLWLGGQDRWPCSLRLL